MLRILKSTNVFESFAHAFLLLFWLFSARLSISMHSYTEVKNNKYLSPKYSIDITKMTTFKIKTVFLINYGMKQKYWLTHYRQTVDVGISRSYLRYEYLPTMWKIAEILIVSQLVPFPLLGTLPIPNVADLGTFNLLPFTNSMAM